MAGKLITGVLAAAGGAALGVLLAPEKGTETRRKITAKRDEYMDKLDEQFEKFQDTVNEKLESFLDTLHETTQKGGRKSQQGSRRGREDDFTSQEGDEQFSGSSGPAL
jgi:gas vesicle protein